MKRAFIAWEIGGGRGHVVHLAAVAAALRRRGYRQSAHLVHLDHAEELAPYCDGVGPAPALPYFAPATDARPYSRYGDWLGLQGFADSAIIRTAIGRWRALIEADRPDIVIAEQAPSAILAARSLDLPVVQVGVPATAPPAGMPTFPPFLSDRDAILFRETALLAALNAAIADFALPPLSTLPAIYTCDEQVVASVRLLDRYDEWRTRPRVPPVIGEWREPGERRSTELFVYLSTLDRLDPVILTAIGSIALPTRAVVADNLSMAMAVISRRGAIVEGAPRPAAEIARTARVLVHAGNHGMCCLGLRAGIPQVTLSAQVEHVFDGRVLAQAGVGIIVERRRWTVPNIRAAIERAWEDEALAARARSLAAELAPEFEGDPGDLTAERIERVRR
jgi:UDP:flavonoid glycosyltransferase YjiC (YdhE family)